MSESNTKSINKIIDVDKVIEFYNEKNPTLKPMTRKELAKDLGCNPQIFSDWKTGRQKMPKLVIRLLRMMELGECELSEFIVEKDV